MTNNWISRVVFKESNKSLNKVLFYGITPTVAGLIICAAVDVSKTCFFNAKLSIQNINLWSVAISIFISILFLKFKIHPILLITISAFMGFGLYYLYLI